MARTILIHSTHATDRVRMARAILALKSCNLHGCARMARAILALKSCIQPCQNGSGHSGTLVMQLAVPDWLEPFLHSSHATGHVRMARAIPALKSCNLHGCARMARAILALKFGQCMALLACKNGSYHSGTANHI